MDSCGWKALKPRMATLLLPLLDFMTPCEGPFVSYRYRRPQRNTCVCFRNYRSPLNYFLRQLKVSTLLHLEIGGLGRVIALTLLRMTLDKSLFAKFQIPV